MIDGNSLITVQSVGPLAAWDKLRGTPLEPWTQLFIDLSLRYSIDLNWILAYLQWENGFGAANTFSMSMNDPWDFLCGKPDTGCGSPQGEGAIECRQAPNGYCYSVFPTMEVGIEAGYKNWARYVRNGWSTWYTSLSVALCGNPEGCGGSWVDNVINQGAENASLWPPPVPPPPPIIRALNAALPIVLGSFMAYAALVTFMRAVRGGVT